MSHASLPMNLVEAIRAAAQNPRLLDPWVRTHDAEGAIVELARQMQQHGQHRRRGTAT